MSEAEDVIDGVFLVQVPLMSYLLLCEAFNDSILTCEASEWRTLVQPAYKASILKHFQGFDTHI